MKISTRLLGEGRGKILGAFYMMSFIIMLPFGLVAQDISPLESNSRFNFGFKFGTSINKFSNQQPHTSVNQGLVAGGFLSYNFNTGKSFQLGAQLEAMYLQQGGNLINFYDPASFGLQDASVWKLKVNEENVRLHNLEVPLLMKGMFNLGANRLSLVVGPSVSYNFNAGIDREVSAIPTEVDIITFSDEENISGKIEDFSYGITSGIGFEIPISPKNYLLIDARYRYSLTSVYNGYSYIRNPKVQGDLKSHSMYFTIGFGF
ncbi:MAG: porin family protein [Marinifilaceae bacterium]